MRIVVNSPISTNPINLAPYVQLRTIAIAIFAGIRHYGLFANANRANNIALARRLLGVPDPAPSSRASDHAENGRDDEDWNACPCCGGRMIIIETFEPGCQPRLWPLPSIGLDSS